jgi:hypothetical protein
MAWASAAKRAAGGARARGMAPVAAQDTERVPVTGGTWVTDGATVAALGGVAATAPVAAMADVRAMERLTGAWQASHEIGSLTAIAGVTARVRAGF